MKTNTSEKGLESLIMRYLTGMDGLASSAAMGVAEAASAYAGKGWFAGNAAAYDRELQSIPSSCSHFSAPPSQTNTPSSA